MAIQEIKSVEICGLSACVPSMIEENSELDIFSNQDEVNKFIENTGVERRRVAGKNECASDLCYKAAEHLIDKLGWEKEEIECLVFVSHGPDYRYPATACVLQSRLGLPQSCMSLDISLGCSGWVYGLSVLGSIVSASKFKKALLLVGDVTTAAKSKKDKSTYPLFGDAGSATAISFREGAYGFRTHMGTDGKNYRAIMVEDGGSRNRVTKDSLVEREYEPGVIRNKLQTRMDGMSVFSFGITKAPKSVKELLSNFDIDKSSIDYYVFHQANLMMNRRIQIKLGIPDQKYPYALKDFGNTSSGTIPLTMVSELRDAINTTNQHPLQIVACGFGVGLSWGSVYFTLENAVCCELLEL